MLEQFDFHLQLLSPLVYVDADAWTSLFFVYDCAWDVVVVVDDDPCDEDGVDVDDDATVSHPSIDKHPQFV